MKRPPAPGDQTPARLAELPTWLVSRVHARAHGLLTEAFAGAGVRGYHYRLMAALEEFGPGSQAALGRRTGIDRSDVVAAINELEQRSLVARSPDPTDGRSNVVTITSAGRREVRKLDSVLAGVQDELLAPLSSAEREQLLVLLHRLLETQTSPR